MLGATQLVSRVRGAGMDWSKIPDILAIASLACAFASILRHNRTAAHRLWLVGWTAIVIHFIAFMFLNLPGIAGVLATIVGLVTLAGAGFCFMWATVPSETHVRSRRLAAVAFLTCSLYLTLASISQVPGWAYDAAAVLIALAPLYIALSYRRYGQHALRWLTVALHFALGAELMVLRRQAGGDPSFGIDAILFDRVRGEIAAGERSGSFERMIRGLLDHAAATDERGFDVLDAFVNGLLSDRPLPVETMALMPDMVSFHKTPVRVVIKLIRLAEMDSDDLFVDIGSGLGQVVLLVNLIGGVRGTGIEYETAYCAYAGEIASRLRLTDTVFVNADARNGDYSKGTVFFLYTPFEGRLLQDVLRLLQKESLTRVIRIFTYGPCSVIVAAEDWCRCVTGFPGDPYQLCLFVRSGQPVYR